MKNISILLTLVTIALASGLYAQNSDMKWAVGVHGGAEQYNGDYGNGFYRFDQEFYGFVGLSVSRNLSDHFDLDLFGSLGEVGHRENEMNSFNFSLLQVGLHVRYNFFQYDDVKFRPFVFAGLGYMRFEDVRTNREFDNMQAPNFGFGFNYKVSPKVSIMLKENFMYSNYDRIELEIGGPNDFYLQHSLGVMYNFGKAVDTDGDGISDRKDECPTVFGIEAFMGCPDTDGDGIKDSEDACPTTSGLPEFSGCPDTDGDGIVDSEDACPSEKGAAELNGCPDTDGDGVADKDDRCPAEAGSTEQKGCPDNDGDGIANLDDRCPENSGPESLSGCPDADGDGVADIDDKCPEVPGIIQNKGCPEVKEETKKILEQALTGIQFQSGKDVITRSSYDILKNVVSIMEENPSYNLKIEGHTDAQGDEDFNLELSKKRAAAVKNHMTDKGVDSARLTSEGFGETKPIADNDTAAGRAKNRRVELTVVF